MPPLLQQSAGNDHHLHFAGALIDLSDLGIAHHALDGIVTSVAVAAEQLQAAAGHVAGGAGCDQLSLSGLNYSLTTPPDIQIYNIDGGYSSVSTYKPADYT